MFSRKITTSSLPGSFIGDGTPVVPADRAHTGVEVENLAQAHVDRSNPPADGSRQRPLDRKAVVEDRVGGVVGKPGVRPVDLVGLLTRVDLVPGNLAFAAIGRRDRGVEDPDRRGPDVGPDSVPLDERDDGVIWDTQIAVRIPGDLGSESGGFRGGCNSSWGKRYKQSLPNSPSRSWRLERSLDGRPPVSSTSLRGRSEAELEFVELFRLDRRRCVHQQVLAALGLRKCDHVAQVVDVSQHHDPAVQPIRETSVGRCARVEGVEQEAKPRSRPPVSNIR